MSSCAQHSPAVPPEIAASATADILLVEDDPALRELLAEFLHRAGYSVRVAGSGRAAMAYFASRHARLLITDLFMPDADGIELLTKLRRTHAGLPIIAMSGSAMEGRELFLKVARHLGALQTLTKPFPLDQLLAAVQDAIGQPG